MHIIQDFLKISNNSISRPFLQYFSIIVALCLGFMIGRMSSIEAQNPQMVITDSEGMLVDSVAVSDTQNDMGTNTQVSVTNSAHLVQATDKSVIFGSSKGKYFYYKGCGGNTISPKNLVYYTSETDAINKGKVLYSKCK
jgi:hypothetical protein